MVTSVGNQVSIISHSYVSVSILAATYVSGSINVVYKVSDYTLCPLSRARILQPTALNKQTLKQLHASPALSGLNEEKKLCFYPTF